MHSNRPLYSPDPSSAGEYVMVVLTLLNNFHKTLRERQSQCLNKVRWGQPVLPGKHASFTIDHKRRGTRNPYDNNPIIADSDGGVDTEEESPPTEEVTALGNKDSDVVNQSKLVDNESIEKAVPVCEQPNVPIITEETIRLVPSVSGGLLHSNQEDNQKLVMKKPKLGKKLGSNKENQKQKGKVHCLQRRNLFRKARQEVAVSPVLPSIRESHNPNSKQKPGSLSHNSSNGIATTPDANPLRESVQEDPAVLPSSHEPNKSPPKILSNEIIMSLDQDPCRKSAQEFPAVPASKYENRDLPTDQICDSPSSIICKNRDVNTPELEDESPIPFEQSSIAPLSPSSEEFLFCGKPSSPRTPNNRNEMASPLRESNPSLTSGEVLSCSPVFSALDSPFRSIYFSRLEDNPVAESEKSALGSVGCLVIGPEETSSKPLGGTSSRLPDPDEQDFVDELPKQTKKPRKTGSSKKLRKPKPMVQCPLCCEWFGPKLIETHAANCGINSPTQLDEQPNNVVLISIPNVNEETCDSNCQSEIEDYKHDLTKNADTSTEAQSVETAAALQHVDCLAIPLGNDDFEEPAEPLSTSLDVSVLKSVEDKSMIEFVNDSTKRQQRETLFVPVELPCIPPEIPSVLPEDLIVPPEFETKDSQFTPVMKRCFICDLSYIEGKSFSNHLGSCRKQYQKLKRQFSAFSEESEEPQRKTRSRRSSPVPRINLENS